MADERTKAPYDQLNPVPDDYAWPSVFKKGGDELFDHYRHLLEALGNEKGLLGLIFNESQNKFQDPAKLRRLLVDLIDKENGPIMSADVKGDAYKALLEKNAQDTKSGAGQCFTPRPLIAAMVDVVAPKAGEGICDPACGTSGFLFAAHDYIVRQNPNLTTDQKKRLQGGHVRGREARASRRAALRDESKASLDIFWLKDESLENSDNLPGPGVIAQEIVEDLEAALEQFRQIAGVWAGIENWRQDNERHQASSQCGRQAAGADWPVGGRREIS